MVVILVAVVILAAALLQDILSAPLVVAILAALAIPAVTSFLTAGLRRIAGSVKPQAVLYVSSLIIVALVQWTAGVKLPGLTGSPTADVATWLGWATVNAAVAATLYDVLLAKLWPGPAPEPEVPVVGVKRKV